MSPHVIDPSRRSAKHERARRRSGDLFLYRRAFAECADRLGIIHEPPGRILIVTGSGLEWTAAMNDIAEAQIVALDDLEPRSGDLIIAVGLFEQVDDPALAAFVLFHGLRPGGRLIGATLGGRSLERLRGAVLDAERAAGRAVQRFHPMLDGPALAGLLSDAGFRDAVLDVDRVEVGYRRLDGLISDLRDMGCTSSLASDAPPILREILERTRLNFLDGRERASETFEILHFSGRMANAV